MLLVLNGISTILCTVAAFKVGELGAFHIRLSRYFCTILQAIVALNKTTYQYILDQKTQQSKKNKSTSIRCTCTTHRATIGYANKVTPMHDFENTATSSIRVNHPQPVNPLSSILIHAHENFDSRNVTMWTKHKSVDEFASNENTEHDMNTNTSFDVTPRNTYHKALPQDDHATNIDDTNQMESSNNELAVDCITNTEVRAPPQLVHAKSLESLAGITRHNTKRTASFQLLHKYEIADVPTQQFYSSVQFTNANTPSAIQTPGIQNIEQL